MVVVQRDMCAFLAMYLVRVDRENEAQMKWIRKQFNSYQGSESRVALSREGA